LAIHATMRPHGGDGSELVPRRPLLSDTKLEAEGAPAERQIVLGWEIDTGELTIRLPWDRERERAFSRWRLFCQKVGIDNHFLNDLPQCERELVCRSFVQTIRWNNIDPTKGTISGRTNHMAASTIRTATSLLGATFKCHYRESPFHLQGNQELRPSIQQLLRAFESVDPPPKQQKAITPRLLRCLAQYGSTSRIVERSYNHAVDLIIDQYRGRGSPLELLWVLSVCVVVNEQNVNRNSNPSEAETN
jgi:hypothetical protein